MNRNEAKKLAKINEKVRACQGAANLSLDYWLKRQKFLRPYVLTLPPAQASVDQFMAQYVSA